MEINGAIPPSTSAVERTRPVPPAQPPSPRSRLNRSEDAVSPRRGRPESPPGLEVANTVLSALSERAGARIRVDESTERIVVQILNEENEVIKQLPPEDLLEALRQFREITGVLFDTDA